MAFDRIDARPVSYTVGSSQVLNKDLLGSKDNKQQGDSGSSDDSKLLKDFTSLGEDRFVNDELLEVQKALDSVNYFSPQVAIQEPDLLYRGLIRYNKSPWDPLGDASEGLVVYDGTSWSALGLDFSADITSLQSQITSNDSDITALQSGKADVSHTHSYTEVTGVTTDSLVGRDTAGTGAAELITLGTNLSMTSGVLNAEGGSKIVRNWRSSDASFPAANYAGLATRNAHPVLTFDTTTGETCYFYGVIPDNYNGEGLTFELWYCSPATTGTIGWLVALEKLDGLDIDADSFAADQTITAATVSGTAGTVQSSTVNIADGTAMDSLVAGDSFRLRLTRNVANDTAADDAQVLQAELRIQ